METREFPTAVIASISTGVLLCKFSDMHEAAEYLMGHPVWTHHFADKALVEKMKTAVTEQCPGMPTTLNDVTVENYREKLAVIESELGPIAVIRKGDGASAMHPLDGIPADKPGTIIET